MVEDIRENKFPYQDIIVNTCVITLVTDLQSNLLEANNEFYNAIGFGEDYFSQGDLNSLLSKDSSWDDLTEKLKNKEERFSTTIKIISKTGKPLHLKCNLGQRDGKVYIVGIDVSDDIELHKTLKTITDIARVGGWTYNPTEDNAHWTDCVFEILEIKKSKDIQAGTILEYVDPDFKEDMQRAIDNLYEKHEAYDIEVKLVTATDKIIWTRIVAIPEVFENQVVYVHGILQDIDSYKRQSISLEETKINMELALRAMNSGYFTHDLLKNKVLYSSSFRDKMNIPIDISGERFLEFIHPEDREEAYKQHEREIATENVYYVNAYRFKSPMGDYKHFEVHGFKVFDAKENPVKLVGNLIDVEDKYRLTQMQDKHRYHIKTLLDNTFVRSIMLDKNWTVIGLDGLTADLFSQRLGYNPILKKVNFKEILSGHDRLKFSIIEGVLVKGKEYRKEVFLDLFEQERTYYDGLFRPILDYSNQIDGYVFYFFDLTDQVKIQEELQSYQDKLRTVHHFKNSIITKIGHEIKTPLHGLLQTTKLIFDKESTSVMNSELLIAQQESANRLMHTFDNIINSSLYEDNFFMIKDTIDISQVLRNMYPGAVNRANIKGLDFVFKNFENPTLISGDPVFLKQSLENLLDNAFKFTKTGSISIFTAIRDKHAVITMEDTGIGIPQRKIDEVFEPFVQLSEGMTRTYEGLGLGLTFAMKYIDGIGGHIHVESVVDQGTKFVLALPLKVVD